MIGPVPSNTLSTPLYRRQWDVFHLACSFPFLCSFKTIKSASERLHFYLNQRRKRWNAKYLKQWIFFFFFRQWYGSEIIETSIADAAFTHRPYLLSMWLFLVPMLLTRAMYSRYVFSIE